MTLIKTLKLTLFPLTLLLIFALSSGHPSPSQSAGICDSVTEIPTGECDALLALYNSTDGANWTSNTGWNSTITPCSWHGVVCSQGRIIQISLNSNQLSGVIPPELGNLSNLLALGLASNQLSGTIPSELGNLSNLQFLTLYSNQLSGNIPAALGNLFNLQDLSLNNNELSGNIPATLGNLTKLQYFPLGSNLLSGTIPPELGNLSNLQYLALYSNQLSGAIPAELGNMSNLLTLNMYSNALSGTIPAELGNLSNLQALDLGSNQLSGNIPAELSNLSNLQTLSLSRNELSGGIPAALGNLPNLQALSLSVNPLGGTIPAALGNLSNLKTLYLNSTELSGTIPAALGNLSNLKTLYLYSNHLSGNIPPELGNLSNVQYLYLHINQLNGAIPATLGNLSTLQDLSLSVNELNGTIPPELGNLSNLQYLYLHNNQLSGAIPSALGNLSNLQHLYLDSNQLNGAIPAALGNLSNLKQLYLYNNLLSGPVPPELGNLSNLQRLYLSNNPLNGTLPENLGGLTKLQSFWLDDTLLTGALPDTLTNLNDLSYFSFQNTTLCEPDGDAFKNWLNNINEVRSSGLSCASQAVTISKSGPTTAQAGQPITYTLTVINSSNTIFNNVVISDTLPTQSHYISSNLGGSLQGDVVTWDSLTLGASSSISVELVVSATLGFTQALVNHDYGVLVDAETRITGTEAVVTSIGSGQPSRVRVLDDNGQPVAGVGVQRNGQPLLGGDALPLVSDSQGWLTLTNALYFEESLVALNPVFEQPTSREAHDPGSGAFAYRVYQSNLGLSQTGQVLPYTIPGSDQPVYSLTVRSDQALILFNIVVSIEWNVSDPYLSLLQEAFRNASDYLYDVSDGQMAFGWVTIYDEKQYWDHADFQISTKNSVRPYAFVGGITSADHAHTIRVGRFWNGISGNQGQWHEPAGYRTLIHEFGHYALHLYDEYFIHEVNDNGYIIGKSSATCTTDTIRTNSSDVTNASIMFYQYNASELADTDRWNANCQQTEQHRLNQGEADWQTLQRFYAGSDWTLQSPSSRGSVMVGPAQFPGQLLAFPQLVAYKQGLPNPNTTHQLTVLTPQGQPANGVLVALYTQISGHNQIVEQGLTDDQGQISIYGAVANDTVKAITLNGAYYGAITIVEGVENYQLMLTGVNNRAYKDNTQIPYLSLIPHSDGDGLYVQVAGLSEGTALTALVIPAENGGSPQVTTLAYSTIAEAYVGAFSLSGVGLGTGQIQVIGSSLPANTLNSDYNLQFVQATQTTSLYAEDGNFELQLPPGSIPADAYATVLPTGYVPGPLPTGKQNIGSAYEVRLSGALPTLAKQAGLRMYYHPEVTGVYNNAAIYYWSAAAKSWQILGSEAGESSSAFSVATDRLGIYALLGEPVATDDAVYLPIIVK